MNKFSVGGGLIESNFEHQEDINVFFTGEKFELYWEANKDAYDNLFADPLEDEVANEFLKPLNFFNILYEQVDIITRCYHRPVDVINHLKSLELDEVRFHLLLVALYNLQSGFYILSEEADEKIRNSISKNIDLCFRFILSEGQILEKKLYGGEPRFTLQYEQVVPVLETIKAPGEKIKYLLERKNFCKKEIAKFPESYANDGKAFIQCCEIEIEHIKRLQAEGFYESVDNHSSLPLASQPIKKKVKQPNRPTQAVLALFYFYIQQTGEFPFFEDLEGGKLKAMEAEAGRYNVSVKNFQMCYNRIYSYRSNRIAQNQVKNMEKVIGMLQVQGYSKALELAEDELRLAKLK